MMEMEPLSRSDVDYTERRLFEMQAEGVKWPVILMYDTNELLAPEIASPTLAIMFKSTLDEIEADRMKAWGRDD